MNKNNHIESLNLSLIRKYVTKTLSESENVEVMNYLAQYPEMKEAMDEMTLADLKTVEQLTDRVNKKVVQKTSSNAWKAWLGAAAIVALLFTISYQYIKVDSSPTIANEKSVPESSETIVVEEHQVPSEQKDVAMEETVIETEVDTFYTVKKKGKEIALDIESVSQTTIMKHETVDQGNKGDTVLSNQKSDPNKQNNLVAVVKPFSFKVSLDYRQSGAVEDSYSTSHVMGNTHAYTGPISGYVFDETGLPTFGSKTEDLYIYLEEELSKDPTLKGISKKMEARVSFMVDAKGKVEDVNIINCNHKQLCMSLSEIFDNFPEWNPSEYKGKKGRVHYVIEVSYQKQ